MTKNKKQRRKQRNHTGRFQDIGKRVITGNWNVLSGRMPFMNDRREDSRIYMITQSLTQTAAFSSSAAGPAAAGFSISLSQLSNVASLTSVFDQYRIVQLEVWAIPSGGNGANEVVALFKSVIDYDNTTTTATLGAFDSYQNCETTTLALGHYRRWQPHTAVAAYSGVFTSFANIASPWIDSASTGVLHYGLKLFSEITPAAVPVDLVWKVHVQFKNVF